MPLSLLRKDFPQAPAATAAVSAGLPPIRETDLDRVLKLIPTEMLAFYTAAVPVLPEVPWPYFSFALFAACTALVPLILFLDGRSTRQPARAAQYMVRTLAFVAWANAISWPFAPWAPELDFHWARSLAVLIVPLIGALALREVPPVPPQP